MIVVVGPSGYEEEYHREEHEDDEDWAGVDIDWQNGKAIEISSNLRMYLIV